MPSIVMWLAAAIGLVSGAALLVGGSAQVYLVEATAAVSGASPEFRPFGDRAPLALHVFAHGGWLHLSLNLVGLVAFGAAVARRFGHGVVGAICFLVFFFATSIAGAAAEVFYQDTYGDPRGAWMVGASTGVSGLIAGAVYVMRSGYDYRLVAPWSARYLLSLSPWVVINVLIGVTGGFVASDGVIAWVAHLGGLAAGVVLFPMIDAVAQRYRPWRP